MSSATARDDTGAAFGGRATFHRFTTRNLCPHCDHEGPCIYFDNGDVLCHREGQPGNWTDSFIGGYWWRATNATGDRPAPRRIPAPSTRPIAPADLTLRSAVYADLLRICPLSQDQLAAHQLTNAQAHRYGWLPSDPADQARIVFALLGTYTREELLGVPGFREHNGHITIRGGDMMMLPTRDLDGKIHAIDLRREVVGPKQSRYVKLSSRTDGDEDAPSPGAPAHVALPAGGVTVDGVIGVTEGVKKADYAADALGYPVVSIPGVGSWRAAVGVLERFAGNVVVLMLDQDDPKKNEGRTVAAVERARTAIAAASVSLGYAVRLATWDHADGKGVDDLLAAGHLFTSERYKPAAATAHVDDTTPRGGIAGGTLGNVWAPVSTAGMVNVDLSFLAMLLKETAASATLRARYQRHMAIMHDSALNDGQKLTAMALFARLPAPNADRSAAPVRICAETIARDLGSKVTIQRDGKERPTKLGTVTTHLADFVDLGVSTRTPVEETRVIVVPNDRGGRRQKTITTTSFAYVAGLSLPGERMDRDEARAAAPRATLDRTRPRCPRCYSTDLKASAHVCGKCGTVSSDVDAMQAAQDIDDHGDGSFNHRQTGEVIVPGIPVIPVEEFETPYRNPVPVTTEYAKEWTQYRIPVTIVRPEQGYRNPVLGGAEEQDLKPCAGGCGTPTRHGWTCKACREAVHIPASTTTAQAVRPTSPAQAPMWHADERG